MKTVAGLLTIANAALFFFGGVQHAGVAMGRFHEPLIIPAAIVEFLCGLCLLLGAIALFLDWRMRWRIALTTNLVALGGVLLGIAALAAGAGPRTASNDLYHRMMLILIIVLRAVATEARLEWRRPKFLPKHSGNDPLLFVACGGASADLDQRV